MLELGSVSPSGGTVAPGADVEVSVTFASSELDEGDYQSTLTIDSNSTDGPIELPLTLHVRQTVLQHVEVDFSPRYADSDGTIEVSVELDTAYDPHNVMISSVTLNGCMLADSSPVNYVDLNRNGVLELILQFDEETFNECMPRNPPDGIHIVTVEGEVQDEAWFTGTAYLRGVVQVGN